MVPTKPPLLVTPNSPVVDSPRVMLLGVTEKFGPGGVTLTGTTRVCESVPAVASTVIAPEVAPVVGAETETSEAFPA